MGFSPVHFPLALHLLSTDPIKINPFPQVEMLK